MRQACKCGRKYNPGVGHEACCRCRVRKGTPSGPVQSERTRQMMAVVAERNAAGVLDVDVAAELGVTREYVRQLRMRLGLDAVEREPDLSRTEGLLEAGFDIVGYTGPRGWRVRCTACREEQTRLACETRPCGCSRRIRVDVGQRFGSWEVIDPETVRAYKRGPGKSTPPRLALCRCDCGAKAWVSVNNLIRGMSKSCRPCGILRRDAALGRDPDRVRVRDLPRVPKRDLCTCGREKTVGSKRCKECSCRNAREARQAQRRTTCAS